MSYRDLINIRYKIKFKLLGLMVMFIGGLIFLMFQETSDVYNTLGYVIDDVVTINIPIGSYLDAINKMEYVKINDKIYNIDKINISEVLIDQEKVISYQQVNFKLEGFNDNQILKVTIYYNKEKVGEKLQKLIF